MEDNNINKKLEIAVFFENLEEVKALLSAGADVNYRENRYGDMLLHITRSAEITKELLLHGAEVNARDKYCETPLGRAASSGKKLEIVKELLKHGANVNTRNRRHSTPLNHAVKRGELEVVKELLKYGADTNMHEYYNLDYAVENLACAKLLIKYTLIRYSKKDYKKAINLGRYEGYFNYSNLLSYIDDCICEVVQMKTDKIKNGLSLYELVTNKFNLAVLNQISVKLSNIDFSLHYPIYNDIILDQIKPFFERANLLNKLSKIQFSTMVNEDIKEKRIILDYYAVYNIAEYLSNDDLLNFTVAFDNSNKRAIQSLSSLDNVVEEPGTSHDDTKRVRLE